MKNNLLITLAVVLVGLTSGCQQSSPTADNSATNNSNSTMQTARDFANAALTNTVSTATQAWANVKASFQSAMGYTYDQKDAFVAKTQDDLHVLDQKIQELSDKAATATDATKADVQTKLEDLRAKRSVLNQKLANVQAATAADWDSAKTDFQNAYDDVKNALKDAWHSLTAS